MEFDFSSDQKQLKEQARRFLSDLLQTIQGNLSPSTTGPILARVNGDLPGSIEPTRFPRCLTPLT